MQQYLGTQYIVNNNSNNTQQWQYKFYYLLLLIVTIKWKTAHCYLILMSLVEVEFCVKYAEQKVTMIAPDMQ